MLFKHILDWFYGTWPKDVPRLYPKLDEFNIAPFLSESEYRSMQGFENVYLLPFARTDGGEEANRLGFGLARVMMRNLMLLRDVSIHGPEDTPEVWYEDAESLAEDNPRSCYVSGIVEREQGEFVLEFEIYRSGQPPTSATVCRGELASFLRECSAAIGRSLGSRLEMSVADGWDIGQPADLEALLRYGDLLLRLDRKDIHGRAEAAKNLLAKDPGFVLPMWEIEDEVPGARALYLKAFERDPYNAQLCFQLFCALFKEKGPKLETFQFCRRAIELSPGHGKSHMCAPDAAPWRANMFPHSELGYRLLPCNSFAITK
jgi:hypothetical protein